MIDILRNGIQIYREEGFDELKNQAEEKFLTPLANWCFDQRYGEGTAVMEEDWDNLIILDACRYDFFNQENTLEGQLESRISRGSTSETFIQENFVGRELRDTVYVSANPYTYLIDENVFHAVLTLLDEWDNELQTVLPECVAARAIEAHESYPNKRLIIHFMQPHQPYIGEQGREIRSRMEEKVDVIGWDANKRDKRQDREGVKQLRAPTIPSLNITTEEVRAAYRENLNIVLEHTASLLGEIDGKTVITADHGELIGERLLPFSNRLYGHPNKLKSKSLRIVPWFIVASEGRRETEAGASDVYERIDEDTLDSKLEALGYR